MKLRSDTLWLAILDKVAHFRQKGCSSFLNVHLQQNYLENLPVRLRVDGRENAFRR
jgi:hypothetical protein